MSQICADQESQKPKPFSVPSSTWKPELSAFWVVQRFRYTPADSPGPLDPFLAHRSTVSTGAFRTRGKLRDARACQPLATELGLRPNPRESAPPLKTEPSSGASVLLARLRPARRTRPSDPSVATELNRPSSSTDVPPVAPSSSANGGPRSSAPISRRRLSSGRWRCWAKEAGSVRRLASSASLPARSSVSSVGSAESSGDGQEAMFR